MVWEPCSSTLHQLRDQGHGLGTLLFYPPPAQGSGTWSGNPALLPSSSSGIKDMVWEPCSSTLLQLRDQGHGLGTLLFYPPPAQGSGTWSGNPALLSSSSSGISGHGLGTLLFYPPPAKGSRTWSGNPALLPSSSSGIRDMVWEPCSSTLHQLRDQGHGLGTLLFYPPPAQSGIRDMVWEPCSSTLLQLRDQGHGLGTLVFYPPPAQGSGTWSGNPALLPSSSSGIRDMVWEPCSSTLLQLRDQGHGLGTLLFYPPPAQGSVDMVWEPCSSTLHRLRDQWTWSGNPALLPSSSSGISGHGLGTLLFYPPPAQGSGTWFGNPALLPSSSSGIRDMVWEPCSSTLLQLRDQGHGLGTLLFYPPPAQGSGTWSGNPALLPSSSSGVRDMVWEPCSSTLLQLRGQGHGLGTLLFYPPPAQGSGTWFGNPTLLPSSSSGISGHGLETLLFYPPPAQGSGTWSGNPALLPSSSSGISGHGLGTLLFYPPPAQGSGTWSGNPALLPSTSSVRDQGHGLGTLLFYPPPAQGSGTWSGNPALLPSSSSGIRDMVWEPCSSTLLQLRDQGHGLGTLLFYPPPAKGSRTWSGNPALLPSSSSGIKDMVWEPCSSTLLQLRDQGHGLGTLLFYPPPAQGSGTWSGNPALLPSTSSGIRDMVWEPCSSTLLKLRDQGHGLGTLLFYPPPAQGSVEMVWEPYSSTLLQLRYQGHGLGTLLFYPPPAQGSGTWSGNPALLPSSSSGIRDMVWEPCSSTLHQLRDQGHGLGTLLFYPPPAQGSRTWSGNPALLPSTSSGIRDMVWEPCSSTLYQLRDQGHGLGTLLFYPPPAQGSVEMVWEPCSSTLLQLRDQGHGLGTLLFYPPPAQGSVDMVWKPCSSTLLQLRGQGHGLGTLLFYPPPAQGSGTWSGNPALLPSSSSGISGLDMVWEPCSSTLHRLRDQWRWFGNPALLPSSSSGIRDMVWEPCSSTLLQLRDQWTWSGNPALLPSSSSGVRDMVWEPCSSTLLQLRGQGHGLGTLLFYPPPAQGSGTWSGNPALLPSSSSGVRDMVWEPCSSTLHQLSDGWTRP